MRSPVMEVRSKTPRQNRRSNFRRRIQNFEKLGTQVDSGREDVFAAGGSNERFASFAKIQSLHKTRNPAGMVMIKEQFITNNYALYNGDCVEVLKSLPDESVGLSIYSPPFCGLYHYSSSERDLSNCRSYGEFFQHYEFVVAEIARLTKPGRMTAVHCMDVPKAGANICGHTDFPGDIIRLHEKHGFEYLPRICIWKEPLGVRNRTMAKALAHRTVVEDSTLSNVAGADYLIPFRKNGKNENPVKHPI